MARRPVLSYLDFALFTRDGDITFLCCCGGGEAGLAATAISFLCCCGVGEVGFAGVLPTSLSPCYKRLR